MVDALQSDDAERLQHCVEGGGVGVVRQGCAGIGWGQERPLGRQCVYETTRLVRVDPNAHAAFRGGANDK